MQNVSELKRVFDRLPMDNGNYGLYLKLLDLDISVYKPLMEEILAGRLDIEDTRPLFSVALHASLTEAGEVPQLPKIIQTDDDLRRNIANRLFAPNEVIKEVTLPNLELNDYRMRVADSYQQRTGETLTDAQFSAIMVAVNATKDINSMSGATKEEQIKYNNAMAVTPITEV